MKKIKYILIWTAWMLLIYQLNWNELSLDNNHTKNVIIYWCVWIGVISILAYIQDYEVKKEGLIVAAIQLILFVVPHIVKGYFKKEFIFVGNVV